jgi:competence protein ComEC
MRVLQFPLIKITGCFVFGLLFAHFTKPPFFISSIALIVSFIVVLITYKLPRKSIIPKNYFGIAALFTAFTIGIFAFVSNNPTRNTHHYIHFITSQKKNCTATISIKEKLKNSSINDRYVAQIKILNGKESYGKILLNLKKSQNIPSFDIGTSLKIVGEFDTNRILKNPNQFDYWNYLENQQIYGQVYVQSSNIKIGTLKDKSIAYYASILRNRIIRNLEKTLLINERISCILYSF